MKMISATHTKIATTPAVARALAAAVMEAMSPAVAGWAVWW